MARSRWALVLARRTVEAAEALGAVQSGQRVFIQGAAAVPRTLLAALMGHAQRLESVEIVHLHTEGDAPYVEPGMQRHFRHRALFVGRNVRQAVADGRADYAPVFLSDIPSLFRGSLRPDVALVNLSPPDNHGYCSLGTSVDCTRAAVQSARLVIAQLNAAVPRTLGDSFVHVDQLHYAVEVNEPLFEMPPAPVTDLERQIGGFVADLVEDRSTLQLGIGGIPNAVLTALSDKRDLGIHSEMISDGVVDLVEAGVVTGAYKPLDPGKVVATFAAGTQRLYDFLHDNPGVAMRPVDYTNSTQIIRRHPRMVAVNSAIQVDLTGQVCADSIGYTIYSGVGGQMDFVRGAALSEGGKAVIALPSTARDGSISRIVPALSEGAGVVTTRAHVQYIVTEFGVADLRGRSLRERAEALTRVAHPAFRAQLAEAAERQQRGSAARDR